MKQTIVIVLTLFLAGCTGPSDSDEQDQDEPIIVTAPDDYSYLSDPSSTVHVHDYWGGRDRITVVDETQTSVAQLVVHGDEYWATFMQWLPPDGAVIPQGTSHVEVRLTMEPNPGDVIDQVALSFNHAETDERGEPVLFEDGLVVIESRNEWNDLPHQVLSGWEFWVAGKGDDGYVRYSGDMHLEVTAVRGLEVPTYPGHPDQWHNRSEIQILDITGNLHDVHFYTPQESCWPVLGFAQSCAFTYSPAEGLLVPSDASYVEAVMTVTNTTPIGLDLWYHGADTREFTLLEPDEESQGTFVYRIPVDGNGDGPYAQQSLWTFFVTGSEDVPERAIEWGDYHLVATVYKDDSILPTL